jgi:hypothetical protein
MVEDVRVKTREQSELYAIVTRLLVACPRNSRAELGDLIARIQKASGGQDTLLDSAMLFHYVARSVPLADGTCAKVAEALARPNRFEALFR